MSLGDPSDDVRASARLSRRGVLRGAAALAGAALLPARTAQAQQAGAPGVVTARGKVPRNVIFMVADGMGVGTFALADQYLRITGGGYSNWRTIAGQTGVKRALQSTYSANSLVTDSAAASSAWATGIKHHNGMLSQLPDGTKPEPILLRAKRAGRAVGCVTTAYISHATPAGFYCNAEERGGYPLISSQLLERPIDVAMGGGAQFFDKDFEKTKPDVRVARTRHELAKLALGPGERLLGIFNDDHVSMCLDRRDDEPGLDEMTRVALERLGASANGFFLQVEGGRVDHAAHANDACSLLKEQLEFDRTLAMVSEWARGHGDTLVVVTTDHSTANPGLAFYGRHGVEACKKLADAQHSFEWVVAEFAKREPSKATSAIKAELMLDLLAQATGVRAGRSEAQMLERFYDGPLVDTFAARRRLVCVLGSIVANDTGVAFISGDHTGDYVELMAFGPGSETLPGFIDNCELHDWVCSVAEIQKLA